MYTHDIASVHGQAVCQVLHYLLAPALSVQQARERRWRYWRDGQRRLPDLDSSALNLQLLCALTGHTGTNGEPLLELLALLRDPAPAEKPRLHISLATVLDAHANHTPR